MEFVTLNGVTIHYARHNKGGKAAGKPSLIFINSLGTDFRIWHYVASAFYDDFDVITYDKRGHGLSSLGKTPYRMEDHAGDLIALMEHLGVSRATLCGVSVGGMIAMRTFAMRPDLVSALVLCDTGHLIGTSELWNTRIETVTGKGIPAISASIMERWFSPAYRVETNPAFIAYRSMLERQAREGYAATSAAIRDEDLTEVAKSINVPTLGLVGEYDGATPPALMEELCDMIKSAKLHIIKDAGHLPSIEQPEVVVKHMRDFFKANTIG